MNKLQQFNLSQDCRDLLTGKKRKNKLSKAFKKEQNTAYLFVLIPMLGFAIFICYPALKSVYLSFTDYSSFMMYGEKEKFVYFDNYKKIFSDKDFWNACLNTVVLLISIPIGISIGLCLLTFSVIRLGLVIVSLKRFHQACD